MDRLSKGDGAKKQRTQKATRGKPLSLKPLKYEEAVVDLLSIKPDQPEKKKKK